MAEAVSAQDPVIEFPTQADWEEWLGRHHGQAAGVWVKLPKKGSGLAGIDYATALDSALCFGWIDGHKKKLDERYWLQRFSPRRPTSRWSQVNRDKVTRLIEAGRVRAPGLAEVERAKADGRWAAAYASPSKAVVPPDFRAALDAVPAAAESFGTLDSRNRFTMIYRVEDAKRPQTRAARIEKFVALLAEGKKLHL